MKIKLVLVAGSLVLVAGGVALDRAILPDRDVAPREVAVATAPTEDSSMEIICPLPRGTRAVACRLAYRDGIWYAKIR